MEMEMQEYLKELLVIKDEAPFGVNDLAGQLGISYQTMYRVIRGEELRLSPRTQRKIKTFVDQWKGKDEPHQ